MRIQAAGSSSALVLIYQIILYYIPEDYYTKLHGLTSQKTVIFIVTAVRTSNLMSVFLFNFLEMEPMTLGSPVGSSPSPVSPGFTSPYLPEFLMGESTPGVSWNVNSFLRSVHIFSLKCGIILCTLHKLQLLLAHSVVNC